MCGLVLVKPHSIATDLRQTCISCGQNGAFPFFRVCGRLVLQSESMEATLLRPQLRTSDIYILFTKSHLKGFFRGKRCQCSEDSLSLSLSHMLPAKTAYVNTCGVSSVKPFTRVPEVIRMWVAKNRRNCRMCGHSRVADASDWVATFEAKH